MKIKLKLKSVLDLAAFYFLVQAALAGVELLTSAIEKTTILKEWASYTIFEFLYFLGIGMAIIATQLVMFPVQKILGLKEKSRILIESFMSPKWGQDILLGFTIGFIFMTVTFSLAYICGAYAPDHHINTNFDITIPLVFFLAVGLAEELIFRGFVFPTIEKGFGTNWSVIITSLLFGFFHMLNRLQGVAEDFKPVACLFLAIEAGFLLNAAYLIRRSLWIPVGIHWSWNLVESSIFGAKEGQIHFVPTFITGHYKAGLFLPGFPMGMESSYITLATGLITGMILWQYRKRTND